MNKNGKLLRKCRNGHSYYKSSDCPVCSICEAAKKRSEGFLALLSAPARRALMNAGISDLKTLSTFKENDLLKLHGFGAASIPKLRTALEVAGLHFAK